MDPATIMMLVNLGMKAISMSNSEIDKLSKNSVGKLNTFIPTAGNALISNGLDTSYGEPDVASTTIGGALTGLSTGGFAGLLTGGLSGFIAGNNALDSYLNNLDTYNTSMIDGATVNPTKFESGGVVKSKNKIQAEEGEFILLPATMEIVKSAAKHKHSNMDRSEVTDVLPDGAFVFSKKNKFKVNSVKDDVLFDGFTHYTEDETFGIHSLEFGDILSGASGEISYADAASRIKNKFKVVNNTDDVFDENTNESNKISRMMYLSKLANLQGGSVVDGDVPKYGKGGPVGILNKALGEVGRLRSLNEDMLKSGREDIDNLDSIIKRNVSGALLSSITGTILQDPTEDPVLYDSSYIDGMYRDVPLSYIETQSNMLNRLPTTLARDLVNNGGASSSVYSGLSKLLSKYGDADASMRSKFALDRYKNIRGRYGELRKLKNRNTKSYIDANNSTRDSRNKLISILGGSVSDYFGADSTRSVNRSKALNDLLSSYNKNNTNLTKAGIDLSVSKSKMEDAERSLNERMKRLESFLQDKSFNTPFKDFRDMESIGSVGVSPIEFAFPLPSIPELSDYNR